ncbi:MAG: sodium:alanine symporter family protein [Sedimentisphaerales bacterium]|nr:sodium:alanine symporter family protein [Sedimentisphaerales bacterium]
MKFISDFIYEANNILWGPITIILLVGTGLYLTIRLRFVQVRHFWHSIKCISGKFDDPKEKGDISHFQALCAALSATIGTGNIAGVATAIALGGPGAVFWMWVTAVVGMAMKFSSCSLALKYRMIHEDGSASGGPMYYLERGLGLKWLAVIFALCAGFASFGIGCAVQANSVTDGLLTIIPESISKTQFDSNIPILGGRIILKPVIGIILAFLVGIVIIGGIKRIAKVAAKIVPLMCAIYIFSSVTILAKNASDIPLAFSQIFRYAFKPLAVGGGFFGFVLARTIEKGVARGIFSNESGLGSAPIAHAAAKTHEMAREGFVAMLGPFIDTIVICTMTALVIIISGLWQVKTPDGTILYGPDALAQPKKILYNDRYVEVAATVGEDAQPFLQDNGKPYIIPTGAALTSDAFEHCLPGIGSFIVSISLAFFAYSTIISWSYYGDRCFEYLLGPKAILPYRYIYCFVVILGAVGGLDFVWTIADNLNALMAAPNLIALLALAGVVLKEKNDYIRRMKDSNLL